MLSRSLKYLLMMTRPCYGIGQGQNYTHIPLSSTKDSKRFCHETVTHTEGI